MTKPTNSHAIKTQISLCSCAEQSDQSSLCALWVTKGPKLLQGKTEVSLYTLHTNFCRFCLALAQIY